MIPLSLIHLRALSSSPPPHPWRHFFPGLQMRTRLLSLANFFCYLRCQCPTCSPRYAARRIQFSCQTSSCRRSRASPQRRTLQSCKCKLETVLSGACSACWRLTITATTLALISDRVDNTALSPVNYGWQGLTQAIVSTLALEHAHELLGSDRLDASVFNRNLSVAQILLTEFIGSLETPMEH